MATDASFIEYIADVARLGNRLTYRKMFGEYALYVDARPTAFVCDNRIYVKLVDAAARLTEALPRGQAYPGSKPYAVADELLDDPPALQALLLETAGALPLPKPKTRKTRGH